MHDCIAVVAAAVAAYRYRKQGIEYINQLALVLGLLDEENAITSSQDNDRRLCMYVCMYVCMAITYSRVWINRVRLPILLVVS